ncbi:MAG: hypothetical protein ACLPXZ_12215 [Mycobacterium sp.]
MSAGATIAQRHLDNGSRPLWQGSVGNVVLVLMSNHYHGRQSFSLSVIENGVTHPAGSWWTYPEAVAAVTNWQQYLTSGGTVMAWLQNNAANAALEAEVLS